MTSESHLRKMNGCINTVLKHVQNDQPIAAADHIDTRHGKGYPSWFIASLEGMLFTPRPKQYANSLRDVVGRVYVDTDHFPF